MSQINRRELLGMLAAAPLPALFSLPRGSIEGAWRKAQDAVASGAAQFEPRFYTAPEWQTVRPASPAEVQNPRGKSARSWLRR